MEKIKFVPLTYVDDTKTYISVDAIEEMYEDKGRTCIITINCDVTRYIKESVSEILAKIGGTAVSDKAQEQDTDFVPVEIEFLGNKGYGYLYKPQQIIVTGYYTLEAFKHFGGTYKEKEGGENG